MRACRIAGSGAGGGATARAGLQPLSPDQLDQLLAPIALYPDPLIAEILPAATLPTEIVMADRYFSNGGDPNLADQQPWDPSVQALTHYPSVLQWMDQNLDWTTQVGQAFMYQQPDVMDSIQRLRADASNLGNLQSSSEEQVVNDGGDIEILPANPDLIYVPAYLPALVYYQPNCVITFPIAPFPVGLWLDHDFDWRHHHLVFWDQDHPRPPNWWSGHHDWNNAGATGHAQVWTPHNRPGVATGTWGDRGWNNQQAGSAFAHRAIPPRTPQTTPVQPGRFTEPPGGNRAPAPVTRPAPAPVTRPAPAPVQRYQPSRPASTGPFIGIQSSSETRAFSERGGQSMGTITRSAPSFNAGGGGGGGRSSGPSRR